MIWQQQLQQLHLFQQQLLQQQLIQQHHHQQQQQQQQQPHPQNGGLLPFQSGFPTAPLFYNPYVTLPPTMPTPIHPQEQQQQQQAALPRPHAIRAGVPKSVSAGANFEAMPVSSPKGNVKRKRNPNEEGKGHTPSRRVTAAYKDEADEEEEEKEEEDDDDDDDGEYTPQRKGSGNRQSRKGKRDGEEEDSDYRPTKRMGERVRAQAMKTTRDAERERTVTVSPPHHGTRATGVVLVGKAASGNPATATSAPPTITTAPAAIPPTPLFAATASPQAKRVEKESPRGTPCIAPNCGATFSLEWRKGPDGLKSLCNACGLRYQRAMSGIKRRNAAATRTAQPNGEGAGAGAGAGAGGHVDEEEGEEDVVEEEDLQPHTVPDTTGA